VGGPVVISMGSNLSPRHHLVRACEQLGRRFRVLSASRVYRSPAVGSPASPPFYNLAVELVTERSPMALKLDVLRPIEASLGRVRSVDRNAPRTLDLDITLFGDRVVDDRDQGLRLPDPEILTRPHVALPLADIVPHFVHPVVGLPVAEIAAAFGDVPEIEIVDGWGLRAYLAGRRLP